VFNQVETQGTITNSLIDDYLLTWMEAFLVDRKARGLADGTLRFYRIKLKLFTGSCETQMVIIPNSQIGEGQVVNYSYPDPSYYDQNMICVAYENDFEQVEKLMTDSIGSVKGVMPDHPVDVILSKFTENEAVFQIGWWIKTYDEIYVIRNRVNHVVVRALKDAGVVFPYRKTSIDLDMDSENKKPNGEGKEEKIIRNEE
jgi:small-conductance mechanosensitive channel